MIGSYFHLFGARTSCSADDSLSHSSTVCMQERAALARSSLPIESGSMLLLLYKKNNNTFIKTAADSSSLKSKGLVGCLLCVCACVSVPVDSRRRLVESCLRANDCREPPESSGWQFTNANAR